METSGIKEFFNNKHRQIFLIAIGTLAVCGLLTWIALANRDKTTTAQAPETTTAKITRNTLKSTAPHAPTTLNAITTTTKKPTTTAPPTTRAPRTAPPTPKETAPASPPEPQKPVAAPSGGPTAEQWAALIRCESGGNYSIVSSNGLYHGAYQFGVGTWNSVAQSAGRSDLVGVLPSRASAADQDALARHLYSQRGNQPWPHCGRHLR